MFVIPRVDEIRNRRLKAGLDMKELSTKASLPGNAILRIERHETTRTNHLRAQAIANALGCPVEELFDVPGAKNKTA